MRVSRISPILLGVVLLGPQGAAWAQGANGTPAASEAAKAAASFWSGGDPRLGDYLRIALAGNPGIRVAFAQYRASLSRLPQVSALPDPMLAFSNDIWTPQPRMGPQTVGVTLSQEFPWFGTLSLREKVAAKEAAMFRERYELSKQRTVQQVKIAYYDLGYIDLALGIEDRQRLLLEHYEELAEARYRQGTGLQQDVVKLQAEITRVRSVLAELSSRRVDSEASMNALLNRAAETPVSRVNMPAPPAAVVDYDALYRLGRRDRPEALEALLAIERDDKQIELAEKSYRPTFNIGGTYMYVSSYEVMLPAAPSAAQSGMNTYSLNLGVTLPVHKKKYDAQVEEATEDKAASRHGYQDIVNSIEASVRQIGFRLTTLREQVGLFQNTLIPQAQQALQSAEAAYSTGTLGVLDLVDAERVLLDVDLGLAQYNSDYMKSLANMERAIGTPFPEVKP